MATPDPRTLVMLQRQMLLIEHVREQQKDDAGNPIPPAQAKTQFMEWPVLSGSPRRTSHAVYRAMEELNLVYGFPSRGAYLFKTTQRYDSWLGAVHSGTFVSNPPEADAFESLTVNLQDRHLVEGRVFVVHGEDASSADAVHVAVCQFIRSRFGYDPVLLNAASESGYLMDNFEKLAASCSVAVCVWTADRENLESGWIRPNVTLETGYFIANLGLHRVIVIQHSNVKHPPSDLSGRAYLTEKNWQAHLVGQLHEAMASIE